MTHTDTDRSTDHDSPWKIALDSYFQPFLELLFPHIPQRSTGAGATPRSTRSCSK